MITRTIATCQTEEWQKQLSGAFTSVKMLLEYLKIPESDYPQWIQAADEFPLRVPKAFADKMVKGDINDPLLRQIMPHHDEMRSAEGFTLDPLMERNANPTKGLLHKYKSRVLVILGSACAVHCRYCFRRHFPYENNTLSQQEFESIIAYVEQFPDVNEVILSGGDPLIASNKRLKHLLNALEQLPHLKRIRFHTRTPVVLPARIDQEFLSIVNSSPLQVIMVLHCNHPSEIDRPFINAMDELKEAGVTLLNQSVLLRKINDCAETLVHLSESLFSANILPYYLHLLDPVAGASHFNVAESEGKRLMAELITALPGYLVPKLVKEEANKPSKTPV